VTTTELRRYMRARRREIDGELNRHLARGGGRPDSLTRAMRYAVLGSGKRLRPILALAAAEAVGGASRRRVAMPAGCAIEMIHAYSLAHDDLPAMDDDDMRRGKPSLHKAFGEASAILAGDALLTEAFGVVARGNRRAGGRVLDLEGEKRKRPDLRHAEAIHERKTGALLRASVRVGGIAAGAGSSLQRRLTMFGEAFGLAFQIADDILDEVADQAVLGKPGGGDRAAGKVTYPAILGLEGARAEARRVAGKGFRAIEPFGRRGRALAALLEHAVGRAA
jgi:geranylgeranyl diphosphate synthase type II